MSEQPIQFDDISPLLSALCDGSLSADDRTQFEQLLERDSLAREWYVAYMDLHGELCFGHMPEGKGVRYILPERPERCFAQNVPDPFSLFHWTREYFSQPGPLSILAATIFMVCLISILSILPAPTYERSRFNHAYNTDVNSTTNSPGRKPRDKDGKLNFVARITGLHNCRWSADYLPPLRYAHLGIGRELKLDSGLVEITYYNGAKIVLEGPVEFTVENPNACRLELGKLTAKVSKSAVGFTVETPTATIVDLGTEFAVAVEDDDVTDVQVFRGVVEAELLARSGTSGKKMRLTKGQAARIDASREPTAKRRSRGRK